MSKFKLRNLMNEKRRIEKEIAKVEKMLQDKNNKKVHIGTVEECIESECTVNHRGGKQFVNGLKYRLIYNFYRKGKEVICDLYCPNTGIVATGVAKCCDEDAFVLERGMKLAEKRALAEYHVKMVEVIKRDL